MDAPKEFSLLELYNDNVEVESELMKPHYNPPRPVNTYAAFRMAELNQSELLKHMKSVSNHRRNLLGLTSTAHEYGLTTEHRLKWVDGLQRALTFMYNNEASLMDTAQKNMPQFKKDVREFQTKRENLLFCKALRCTDEAMTLNNKGEYVIDTLPIDMTNYDSFVPNQKEYPLAELK